MWTDVRWPLAVYVISRALVVSIAAVVAVVKSGPRHLDPAWGPWLRLPPTEMLVFRTLGRWDGSWYLRLAERGYPTSTHLTGQLRGVAFFPLFPLLARAVSSATGLSLIASGVLVSTLLGAVATVLVWRLTLEITDRATANRVSALFCFFPGAFVFSMAYAEPLMLVGGIGCLLALLRRRWVIAGLLAAIATASRPNAAVVVLVCAWAAGAAIIRNREWRAVWAPALAPLGALSFFGYLWVRTGDATAWFRAENQGWNDQTDFGVAAIGRFTSTVTHPHISLASTGLNDLIGALGLVFVLVTMILLWRWRPPALVVVYALGAVALALTSKNIGLRPRMLLASFPLIMAIGAQCRGRAYAVVLSCSAALLVGLSLITFTGVAATP